MAEEPQLRHDHGSAYMSDHFRAAIEFLGISSSPAFVRAPEGRRATEGFTRPFFGTRRTGLSAAC